MSTLHVLFKKLAKAVIKKWLFEMEKARPHEPKISWTLKNSTKFGNRIAMHMLPALWVYGGASG